MSDRLAPRALIIGGSLGGLLTATTLRAIGWRVDVFERSPHALDSRGGGLVLQPDVLHAFAFAGLRLPATLGVESGDRIFLDRAGNVVQRGWQPQTQTSWNMLYGVLRDAVPDECVHAGETLVRVEQAGGQVRAHFAGGRIETAELLVGADGARSTVRELMLPDVRPAYAGYVAWRGLVPEGADGATAPGRRRWNWVWFRRVAQDKLPALLTDRDGRAHAFSLPPRCAPGRAWGSAPRRRGCDARAPFRALVHATSEPFIQAILDLAVPRMVFGRILLSGDAAFVPRPHTAGGAAKAAANALALALALRKEDGPLDHRLQEWEVSQLRAGRTMTDWGKRMGDQIMGLDVAAEAVSQ